MTSQDIPESTVPPNFSSGSRIADYLLEEQIGEGGMAVVFRAHDERLDRTVALKILAPALAGDEGFRRRFIRESRAAAAVDDPHIIPVFEAGEASGALFIAMRFVRGGDVRQLVAREGSLPAGRAADIISQAASALDAAHSQGLVHRDVKPANMLLDSGTDPDGDSDHVYLSDFGLTKASMHTTGLTKSGMFLGTLDYVSPEQIEGKLLDGRADEYSLACAAFELLSGVPPFQRDDVMAVMYAQLHAAPPLLTSLRPGFPAAADEVFARALAKSPADRYESCRRFSAALRRALGVAPDGSEAGQATEARPHLPQTGGTGIAAWETGQQSGPKVGVAGRTPTELRRDSDPAGPAFAQPVTARPRRSKSPALLVGACIVVAAVVVSGAILFSAHGQSASKPSTSGAPTQSAGQPSQRPGHTGSGSAVAGVQGTQAKQSSGSTRFRLVAPLYPGASTVSISSVAWNLAGSLVAASDKNGSTYLWNAATATSHGPALPGPAEAYSTAFSPDGTILATGYQDGSTNLWNVATGHLVAQLHDPGRANGKEVDTLAFSPAGRMLATSDGNGYTNLWTIGSGGQGAALKTSLADPAGAGVYSVAFSSKGALATGDYEGHVYLWDVASGASTATFSLPGRYCTVSSICAAVSALTFSQDGNLLAVANVSGNAELWNVAGQRGGSIWQPSGQGSLPAIWAVSFDGNSTLALACSNGRSYLWQVNAARLTVTAAGTLTDPHSGAKGIGAEAFSAGGQFLVTGDTNGSAYLWKTG